jgi:hypothetical protein
MAQSTRTARTLKTLTNAGVDIADAAVKLGESAVAAGTVIGHRVAMGAQAMQDPASLDHAEVTRMSAEKIVAFTASSHILLNEMQGINREVAEYAIGQATSSLRAAFDLATAHDPLSVLEIQRRWLIEAWTRSSRHALQLTALSAGASTLALAPVHATVTGNARRLSRRR